MTEGKSAGCSSPSYFKLFGSSSFTMTSILKCSKRPIGSQNITYILHQPDVQYMYIQHILHKRGIFMKYRRAWCPWHPPVQCESKRTFLRFRYNSFSRSKGIRTQFFSMTEGESAGVSPLLILKFVTAEFFLKYSR